jgi:hypothetical protein
VGNSILLCAVASYLLTLPIKGEVKCRDDEGKLKE